MLSTDRDALICDLAETYGLFDIHSVPLPLLATLACGLRENARIWLRMSGQKYPLDTVLLAGAVDYLALLFWSKTEDARRGQNRPESILARILQQGEDPDGGLALFESTDSFDAARKQILDAGR